MFLSFMIITVLIDGKLALEFSMRNDGIFERQQFSFPPKVDFILIIQLILSDKKY